MSNEQAEDLLREWNSEEGQRKSTNVSTSKSDPGPLNDLSPVGKNTVCL